MLKEPKPNQRPDTAKPELLQESHQKEPITLVKGQNNYFRQMIYDIRSVDLGGRFLRRFL